MLLMKDTIHYNPSIAAQLAVGAAAKSPLFRHQNRPVTGIHYYPSSIITNAPPFGCCQDVSSSLLSSPQLPSSLHTGLLSAVATLPTTTATTAATTTGAVGFVKLFTAFCLGGIFFSTAIATVSACYAIGMENVRYLWDVVGAVLQAVWVSFQAALSTARSVLKGNYKDSSTSSSTSTTSTSVTQYKNKWRQAWAVLKQELVKTRQTAAEGVAAIRQEASLYAGAVGAPGLIPLQYILDRFLPFAIEGALEDSLRESLQSMPRTRSIHSVKLDSFSVGTQSPQLEAARAYELGKEAVAFDCDIDWPSDLEIRLTVKTVGGLARIPVTVKNVSFKGVLRVILTPLVKQSPGYGAALVSFPKTPQIGLDVRVAGGDITKIPWLRSELIATVKKSIADELLWPKRVVVPTMVTGMGGRERPLLSSSRLQALATTDPLLVREQELAERPILRQQMEKNKPGWTALQQQFKVFVNRPNNSNQTVESEEKEDNQKEKDVLDDSGDHSVSSSSFLESEINGHHQHGVAGKEDHSVQRGVLWQKLKRLQGS